MIQIFRIQNKSGAYIEVSNYGATLVSVVTPDKSGELENIILSYNNPEDYYSDKYYLGSTIGRFANRISNARFELDGKMFFLDENDGKNSNHGGFNGFNSKVFGYQINDHSIEFSYFSKDGEGGFPGNLQIYVTYSFSEDNVVTIEYRAISDKLTIFNPTNHAYFNLSGKGKNILDHELKVYADKYLESDEQFLPTGRILDMSDSPYDFREYNTFSELMPLKNEIIKGYNTYFIANSTDACKLLASLKEKRSGRQVDIYSTMPGIQVYTGDYLSDPFIPFAGVALEAQFYPDTLNHSDFPSCVLYPDKEIRHIIKYCMK